jgi:site-specific DNA recombinase
MSLASVARNKPPVLPKTHWCAIYTRKSTDENLNTDFNSLDSQREYCQSFVKSREGEGWRVHPEEYNDPGFSGGNMDRPGLKKLLADAQQGKFQVVVCYKYDRLSRNTKDFLHVLDVFDRHGVAFVSVTQPIDTTSSVGRLMRSILMDFAQFEREMISERTRDKLAGMARKGKRTGGHPILGYDIDPEKKGIKINQEEVPQVLEMFKTYLSTKSLSQTAKILNERGYRMKRWTTHGHKPRGGKKFNKMTVCRLLRNPLYVGRIVHKGVEYKGEHEAIVPEELFNDAGALMDLNWKGAIHKDGYEIKHNFVLRGLLRCGCCGSSMNPYSSYGHGGQKFFYYKCLSVSKLDKTACEVRSVPAKTFEEHVIRRLGVLGENVKLLEDVVKSAQSLSSQELPIRRDERKLQALQLARTEEMVKSLIDVLAREGPNSPRRERILGQMDRYMAEELEIKAGLAKLDAEIADLEKRQIDAGVVRRNLAGFVRVYEKLNDCERREILRLLLRAVTYNPKAAKLTLHLNPLPDLWGEVTALEQVCADSNIKLRISYSQRRPFLELSGDLGEKGRFKSSFWLEDVSEFAVVRARRGQKRVVFPEEVKPLHSPTGEARQLRIKELMTRALEWQARLHAQPRLTQTSIAKETGLNRVRVTQILNLLRLAPEIQQYILAMLPTTANRVLTENRLRSLVGIQDQHLQVQRFKTLIGSPTAEKAVV